MKNLIIITTFLVSSSLSFGQTESSLEGSFAKVEKAFSRGFFQDPVKENQREKLIRLKEEAIKVSRDGRATYQKLDSIILKNTNRNTGQLTSTLKSEYTYDAFGNNIQFLQVGLDTINNQWINQYRIEFGYDVLGNEILNTSSFWDANNGVWVYTVKIATTIDNSGNTTSIKQSYWNQAINNWRISSEEQSIYDINNNIIEFRTLFMDTTTNQLFAKDLQRYSYNGNGDMVSSVGFYRDFGVIQWDTTSKVEATYLPNGDLESTIGYVVTSTSNGQLIKSKKNDYGFDSSGNIELLIKSDWNVNTNQWDNDTKSVRTFNLNGGITLSYKYYWDGSGWQNNHKTEFTYDNQDNLILRIDWVYRNGQWENGGKNVSLFDANSNRLISTNYLWKSQYNQWDPSNKVVATFDLNYNVSDLLVPNMSYGTFYHANNIVLNTVHYASTGGPADTTISKNGEESYFYSTQYINSISEYNDAGVSVYPNPFTNTINVDIENGGPIMVFTVFDIQGKRVYSNRIENHDDLDLSKLKSGIYIYTLSKDNEVIKGKIIKQ